MFRCYTFLQEYKLALWQCYGRYLRSTADVNVEEVTDAQTFQETFVPNGFDREDAGFTVSIQTRCE